MHKDRSRSSHIDQASSDGGPPSARSPRPAMVPSPTSATRVGAMSSRPARMTVAGLLFSRGGRGSGYLSDPAAELDPGVQAQLVEDVGDMGLNGALRQEQPGRDLLVGEAAGNKPGDFQLPAGESKGPVGLGKEWRLRRLFAFHGKGGAFADRHGAATRERGRKR